MDKGVERIYPNGEGNMDFSNVVRMVKKMNDGTVMVGTRAGSLYHYSADMSQVLGKSHFDSNVYGIVQMPNGETWIAPVAKESMEQKDSTLRTGTCFVWLPMPNIACG